MLGINPTGKDYKKHYLLGRGCIYIAPLNSSTGLPDTGFRNLGHASEISISPEINEVEHVNLCVGNGDVDEIFVTRRRFNLAFTLEEVSHENSALYSFGTIEEVANPAVAGIAAYDAGIAVKGRSYQIQNSSGVRAFDIQDAGDVTVKWDVATANTTLVLGTDYELDLERGLVFILKTSTGVVTEDKLLNIALAADANPKANVQRVLALADDIRDYAVFIKGLNGKDGEPYDLDLHSVRLKPAGSVSLINLDQQTQLQFEGVAQVNTALSGASKTFTVSKAAD